MDKSLSDDILTAYLDGELDPVQSQQIEARLASDAALGRRLDALRLSTSDIQDAFDALLPTAPAVPPLPEQAPQSGARVAVIAAAVLGLGIALGAVWSPRSLPDVTDWKLAVANYQLLYVPETLAQSPPTPKQAQARLTELSKALGYDVSSAFSAADLNYRRAQMLRHEGEPLVQIAYLGDGDIPFAFCITPVSDTAHPLQVEMLSGLASAHWVQDGYGFLVIGGQALDRVSDIAQDLQSKI
ncbi:hypothetical protein TRP8649_02281 [Pelagimonas phthalicica]|uniref:Transmembrane transcriptional regulator (Anti-sigma factor RsiW) n=1 Tax=Pelagimonas phthalicica TaxID=1037362 RepID=A0A238JEA3_9RHOB|nr:hypothetical protein [Pelagimonas phthalicica]TDS91119.1 anti-sigma factor RsiW [Pelagimonas phthalicica]SMX28166.1 hypothetical protein TRP8649_02281 [Pelagimonas phthalicica]